MKSKAAIIIGAGPAGLTAAWELMTRTGIKPIVIEADNTVGGICRTASYKGNRIDIGGHRFFSKSDRVMRWWLDVLPLESSASDDLIITYQNKKTGVTTDHKRADPKTTDRVMLVRQRRSRIFYRRRFFNYPITLSVDTLRNLGLSRIPRIAASYLYATARPIHPEQSLEDFFINRFGNELYLTFFKDYTEKVWGVPCHSISPEWGAQRIKGLSFAKALSHAAAALIRRPGGNLAQKDLETSLIERFLYPKFGPGQMWDVVAERFREAGGTIHMQSRAVAIDIEDARVKAVRCRDAEGNETVHPADYVFSTMPVCDLIPACGSVVPDTVRSAAAGLVYRDFITVGVLLRRLHIRPSQGAEPQPMIPDNWIYIQDKGFRIGRLQIYNNWSPWLVADPDTVWLGMEYFCREGDDLWAHPDPDFIRMAISELIDLGFAQREDVLDASILRLKKAYPAYFGGYDRFAEIRNFTDTINGLFLIGRNGMHKYNNADHSMLTAMTAVDNLVSGLTSKNNLWEINTEQDYHEEA